ncbi:MAG TPA: YceI family protein [Solirubrobacteraceae bacterium]|nr:YceI family protein [Solirubrobacteraceae bacterium]
MSTTLQQVPTGTYTLDPIHSTFGFAVKHNGISLFRGQFEHVDASLEDGVLRGTAYVDSVKTAIADLKGHLLAPDFFNAEQTPTVDFRSTEIRVADDGGVEVDGELTIRGVTRPVTATGSFAAGVGVAGGEVAGFDLEVRIDRRDYGLDWQAPLPSGGDALAWDVRIEAHLELVRQ